MTGGQRATIQTEKTPTGMYRASILNDNINIPPVEDKVESVAVRLLTDRLNEAYVKGEVE